jgi:hypothetical protein
MTTLVILEVTTDDDREWWEALGVPAPHRWDEALPDIHIKEVLVKEIAS